MQGKRVIVTGAASGIGYASARLFAREGAAVLMADRNGEQLERACTALRDEDLDVRHREADCGAENDVRALIDMALRELSGLDVFFANAGIAGNARNVEDTSVELFQEVLRVNLIGPFLAIKHSLPSMRAQGSGSIVCTASVSALAAHAGPTAYAASKAGVVNLVRTAAHDLRGTGVRVNAICPGLVETGLTRHQFENARARGEEQRLGFYSALKRPAQADEIAAAALFLGSDDSSYVTGHALVVDGGLSATVPFVPKS
jgi:NAD(P)-dependent dehydrogenase (short-subunit alcohol dehydrogenase family)